jgi:phenylacetate-CoA ligase
MHTVLDAADDPASLAGSLLAVRPVAISGFGHLLLDVAEHVAGGLRPKVLGTGGQVLSPSDRQALTEAFGTQPLDLYGSVEVGSIAWQCASADLYHLEHDSVLVELLDEDGAPVLPGEVGEVILTSLQNPHMPFVRYRVGDRARLADRPCRCGDALPALLAIEGREMDRFVDERGETVASSRLFLSGQMEDDLRWVRRYRVRQDSDRRVTVELVTTGPLPDHVVARIIDGYRSVLGGTSAVTIAVVDDIPLEASGKLRQFTSCATIAPPAGG